MKDHTPSGEPERNPVGRPLKFKTVAELDMAIQAYFDEQDPHIVKPDDMGSARHYDVTASVRDEWPCQGHGD